MNPDPAARCPNFPRRRVRSASAMGTALLVAAALLTACLPPAGTATPHPTAVAASKPALPPKARPATTGPTAPRTSAPSTSAPGTPAPGAAAPTTAGTPRWGVYSGPGVKGAAAAPAFGAATGLPITEALDFGNASSWTEMTRIGWLLSPYTGSGLHLTYSLPMLPDVAGVSLTACAAGDYDTYWTQIGAAIVAAGLPTTTVRPGWELNGSWYRWNAAVSPAGYAGCFRHVVSAMRTAAGQAFTFEFNANLGLGTLPAELAYPGDGYVDIVGVDAYDTSWTWYPVPAGVTTAAAQANAWNWLYKGNHGLAFWSAFAATHAKPLSITEWAATWRSDGHGGGDNPYFTDRMLDFIADPANHVLRSDYFNSPDTATLKHDITRLGAAFPLAAAELRNRARLLP